MATKELKLDHVEKFVIRDLANDIKERGCVELIQPGGFDELVQICKAGGDGIEPLNYRIESRKVTITTLLRVMCEPDLQRLEMVHETIRTARDLEASVDTSLDC